MAPAQLSPENDRDSKLNFAVNTAEDKGNTSILSNSNGNGLRCMSNSEDAICEMEVVSDGQTEAREGAEDVAVTVSELTSCDIKVSEAEDPDATEYSSSFADTISENENCSELSDAEVESQFYGDNDFTSAFDGFSSVFPMRKKKLTDHWRSFIRPLMWRCQWTELRIKEIGSQALKYSRELEAHDQRKHVALEQFALEGLGSRSLPFTFQSHGKKAMKRRKRKRVEDSTDIKSYMSDHNLFSFCENKKSEPDGTFMPDDFGDPVHAEQNTADDDEFAITNEWSFLEEKDNNTLEQIFRKIEIVQSRVHKLKNQLDLVLSKNVGRFSSSENLSHLVPCDALTSSVRSPTYSACNEETISVGGLYTSIQCKTEYDMGDLMLPESAVSSYGQAIHVPDIIESTVGLLSSTDVTQNQSLIGDSSENILDNIPIHSEAAEVERDTSEKNCIETTEQHQEPEKSGEEESTDPALPALESDTLAKPTMPQEQSALKSCLAAEFHFPKNKRKRGERKAGAGGWSRQCPGEPDCQ